MKTFAAILLLATLVAAPARADDMARWRAQAARVQIVRDDWGVAHIHGKSDADAVFGMVYAQAEDDFNRVETNYINALGRLAEAEGEAAVWQDLRMKLFVDPADLKQKYAASPVWLKSLMNAWADGLNFYLASHPNVKPRVIARFEPWMALSFTEGSIGGDIAKVSLAGLESFYGQTQVAERDDPYAFHEPTGSNGIVITPANSKSGHALLLINPHTSFFFRSELQMTSDEGLNAYGAATWGQPFLYQGFNEKAGWMHTTSGADNVDEFAETVVRRDGQWLYRYGGEERPVKVQTISVAYRTASGGLASKTFKVFRTHHGPIVRAENGRWIAVSLMVKPVEALQQSYLRTKAADLAAFMKVAELKANSSNNTLFADAKGETAFLMPQFMPRRDDRFDYTKPVDGADPATDWQGLHALSQLPQVVNPANGWAFNVNDWPYSAAGANSPRRENYPRYFDQNGATPRGVHARRVLENRGPFDAEGLRAAAYDPYLPAFADLVPGLLRAYDANPDPRLAEPVAALRAWDFRWSTASIPTSLAVVWGEILWDLRKDAAKAQGVTVYRAMETASGAEKLAALNAAVGRLTTDFGTWRMAWGEINRYQRNTGAIVQTFDDAKPSLPVGFTSGQWGSLASFGAKTYPGAKRYYGNTGNSFVAVVEFGPRVQARAVSTGGESGDPASPHFADQARRYVEGDLRPVYFYPEDVAAHARRRYRPGE